jgi:hypothetical protein
MGDGDGAAGHQRAGEDADDPVRVFDAGQEVQHREHQHGNGLVEVEVVSRCALAGCAALPPPESRGRRHPILDQQAPGFLVGENRRAVHAVGFRVDSDEA